MRINAVSITVTTVSRCLWGSSSHFRFMNPERRVLGESHTLLYMTPLILDIFTGYLLAFYGLNISIFQDCQTLDYETIGIIIRPRRIGQATSGHETALCDVALTDNHLLRVCLCDVRIIVEITDHTVHLDNLSDVSGYNAVIISFLNKVRIVIIGTLVSENQRTVDIVLDCRFIGRQSEEQFMESAHMLAGLRRAILVHVLRQGKHK